MPELRWLLLVLGLAVVAGVYVYTRLRPASDRGPQSLAPRREPTIGGEERARTAPEIASEALPPDPSPGLPPDPEPAETSPVESKIVAVRLMAREAGGFPGDQLILAMREFGFQHGDFGIFHHPADDDVTRSDFSIASLVEPGSFDLTNLKTDSYPGVSIFMTLPGARDGVEIFDDMLHASRSLSRELNGELLDEQGSSLSVQRERYLREEVIQFEHRGNS
ncbi:MAG: cell division protein ZipA C-terminal FtsZ-binding domain-containing protein [Woeseiaceae bacterium]